MMNQSRNRPKSYSRSARLLLMVGAVFFVPFVALHAETGPDLATFEKEIRPLLNKYCISCHGPDKSKADVRFDELDPDLFSGGDGDIWEEVYNQLNIGDMPPEDEKQPTTAEREKISAWVHGQIHHAAEAKRSTGGRNVLRRLTAYEYNNTLRDLLGVDLDFAKDLPPEAAAAEGFVNNYEVLGTSSLHIEYFYKIAKDALERALLFGEKPTVLLYELNALENEAETKDRRAMHEEKAREREAEGKQYPFLRKVRKSNIFNGEEGKEGIHLSPNGGLFQQEIEPQRINKSSHRIPPHGPMRVTVRAAAASLNGDLKPYMEVKYGITSRDSNKTVVKTLGAAFLKSGEFRDYVFEARAENFPPFLTGGGRIQLVEIYNSLGSEESAISGNEMILESIRIEAPYFEQWPPKTRTQITGVTEHPEGSADAVSEILSHFMTRAYRRPVRPEEVEHRLKLYQNLRSKDFTYEQALIETLSAVLSSYGFLLLAEPAPLDGEPNIPRDLNGYEIASRLSYFLWSTMPDAVLLALAANGKLSDKQVLAVQVQRMLEDPRAGEFTNNFTRQWLGLDHIYSVAINPEYFPDFEEAMKDEMIEETVANFDHIVSENRSCLELIDSDEVVINGKLAAHYGMSGVAGEYYRPVALHASSQRGGLLSQASILTLNSSGDDTHPIKRGVWVLERLLGDPPPPPPPGVPPLEEDGNEEQEQLSLRKRLEAHREQESCNTCHRKIDPWGVAFENFDGIGVWRNAAKADTASGEQSFPTKGIRGPQLKIEEGAPDEVITLTRAANRTFKSLNQAYDNIRKQGTEGKLNELRRVLVIVDSRQHAVNVAIDNLLLATGEDREQFLEKFRSVNAEALTFNRNIRTAAEALLQSAVDPRTELADGTAIADLEDLKAYILENKRDQFAENFVRKLMAYALGRHLDFTDRESVEALTADFASNNYKPRELITNIILSESFLTK